MNQYVETAIKAVEAASAVCRKIQDQLVHEDTLIKKDRSPVTIADYASQAVICKQLKEIFPDIPIVGEEDSGDLNRSENKAMLQKISGFLPDWSQNEVLTSIEHGNGKAAELFWTLDPIDGTKGFLRRDQYALALALIQNGQIIAGVLGCPNLPFEGDAAGTIMFASHHQGAYARSLNGGPSKQVHVSDNTIDDEIRFLESVEAAHSNHGLQGTIMDHFGSNAKSVRYDSQVKYAVLAQGMADVYLRLPNPKTPDYREKIWDHAAGSGIVCEAGGKITDMKGNDLDFSAGHKLINNRGVVVSNGQIHDKIIDLLNS